jgi:hypothetical protein
MPLDSEAPETIKEIFIGGQSNKLFYTCNLMSTLVNLPGSSSKVPVCAIQFFRPRICRPVGYNYTNKIFIEFDLGQML